VIVKSLVFFILAAFFEIFGCYTFWLCLRLDRSAFWLLPGTISLTLFALALTQIETQFAGRAFAAYGGIYIASSLVWLRLVERKTPDLVDFAGSLVCLIGAGIILFGHGIWRTS
jgi:small multidrug resistance family-3 protein